MKLLKFLHNCEIIKSDLGHILRIKIKYVSVTLCVTLICNDPRCNLAAVKILSSVLWVSFLCVAVHCVLKTSLIVFHIFQFVVYDSCLCICTYF